MQERSSVRQCDIALETNADKEMTLLHIVVEEYLAPSNLAKLDLSFAVCIIYLIDGTNVNEVDAANFLNSLFTNPQFLENPAPVLLAVNKSDLKNCKFNTDVYDAIEREVGKLRGDEKYTFKKYAPCTVYSMNCSVLMNNLRIILEFIGACV